MDSKEIRKKFLGFFQEKDHVILPSAPLVPNVLAGETDTTLFNTAGMQPLIPYLMGKEHPKGKRLASVQKCIRTVDIEEVGDNTHATFFEMLGNWSLGDYFKKESIHWSWNFLVDPQKGLGLDPKRIYVTVFSGGNIDGVDLSKDNESFDVWKEIFLSLNLNPEKRIFLKKEDNWWSAGANSPSGTTTEIFYDLSGKLTDGLSNEEFLFFEEKQDLVEVWNNVFMEFVKENGVVRGKLPSKNVDTGAGLERLSTVLQSVPSIFDTDLFHPLIQIIRQSTVSISPRSERIISDHLKAAVFIIADGIKASNTKQGYVLRRLFRRAFRELKKFQGDTSFFPSFLDQIFSLYGDVYDLSTKRDEIENQFFLEWERYERILSRGRNFLEKMEKQGKKELTGKDIFYLEQTEGIHLETLRTLLLSFSIQLSPHFEKEYLEEKELHRKKSQTAAAGLFKGGLAGDSPKIRALHTATHLLLAALRKYLGNHVFQKGSNITEERTRFDFSHPEKVSDEILRKIEDYINSVIETDAEVTTEVMDKEEAKKSGVVGSFWEKYPEKVKVWTIKDSEGNIYSRELCGGPHVKRLSEIKSFGKFKIKKESSSSSGVRRIKAVLE